MIPNVSLIAFIYLKFDLFYKDVKEQIWKKCA